MDVLVLNSRYMPLQRVSWQRAFGYLCAGKAEVVEIYDGRVVRSSTTDWPMPSIVRLFNTVVNLFNRGVKFSRRNVYLRDRGTCQYCGRSVSTAEFTLDHVVPRCKGGRTTWENLVTSCARCNHRKGSRSVRDAGLTLKTKPIKPRFLPGSTRTLGWQFGMPESWAMYLGAVTRRRDRDA